MTDIAHNLRLIHQQIEAACQASQRSPDCVQLLAVSKTKPSHLLKEAWQQGQRHFGENYLQEALDKQAELETLDLKTLDIVWHFIGPIQSNKTRAIAENFTWVHSVDRLKVARRLSEQRPTHLMPLQVCIQVNISEEDSKSGCLPDEVLALASDMTALPNIEVRGLMAIPKATHDPSIQQASFDRMRALLAELKAALPNTHSLDTLSMGMSGDLGPAIAAGSTMVRIGTALFGARG